MKFILIFFLLISITFADENFNKHLKSEDRAEVYAQNLLEGGYDEKLQVFLVEALKKYPQSEELLMFSATSFYHLKKLSLSKKYFKKVLEVNPANEQASDFIGKIEDQESSKENKVLENLIEYLQDKGLDFIMIFLAFLGGEIIAKKYAQCSKNKFLVSIAKYRNRKLLSDSTFEKIKFSFVNCCISKKLISLCSVLEILIASTIVVALLIVWLMIEFLSGLTMLLNEPIAMLSAHSLWVHTGLVFILLLILTITIKFIAYLQSFEDDESLYVLDVAQELEHLYENREYILLKKAMKELLKNKEDMHEVLDELNGDLRDYIKEKFPTV